MEKRELALRLLEQNGLIIQDPKKAEVFIKESYESLVKKHGKQEYFETFRHRFISIGNKYEHEAIMFLCKLFTINELRSIVEFFNTEAYKRYTEKALDKLGELRYYCLREIYGDLYTVGGT